jgi:transcriptional regulator with XRE-family HTH domain
LRYESTYSQQKGPKADDQERMLMEAFMSKNPNPIDKHVGSRVRMRRVLVGLSQERLGESLGVTFQQVQKYEKGTNRIGASRLQQISNVLGVPIAFFFEDAPGESAGNPGFSESPGSDYVVDFLSTSEGVALTRAFLRVKDPKVRRRIVDLVTSIADATTAATGTPGPA